MNLPGFSARFVAVSSLFSAFPGNCQPVSKPMAVTLKPPAEKSERDKIHYDIVLLEKLIVLPASKSDYRLSTNSLHTVHAEGFATNYTPRELYYAAQHDNLQFRIVTMAKPADNGLIQKFVGLPKPSAEALAEVLARRTAAKKRSRELDEKAKQDFEDILEEQTARSKQRSLDKQAAAAESVAAAENAKANAAIEQAAQAKRQADAMERIAARPIMY